MKNDKPTNTVNLQGRVGTLPEYSHDMYGERFYEFKLNVPRLSEHLDIIPVTVSEELSAKLTLDSQIAVSGQFRSFNRPDGERSRLILSVYAREITPPEPDGTRRIYLQTADIPHHAVQPRDLRHTARRKPRVFQVRLHTVHRLGKECQTAQKRPRRAKTRRLRAHTVASVHQTPVRRLLGSAHRL